MPPISFKKVVPWWFFKSKYFKTDNFTHNIETVKAISKSKSVPQDNSDILLFMIECCPAVRHQPRQYTVGHMVWWSEA